MRPVAEGKVLLQGMDADTEEGRDTLKKYSIDLLPAYVLTDVNGRVVQKGEGSVDLAAVRATLEALAGKSGRK